MLSTPRPVFICQLEQVARYVLLARGYSQCPYLHVSPDLLLEDNVNVSARGCLQFLHASRTTCGWQGVGTAIDSKIGYKITTKLYTRSRCGFTVKLFYTEGMLALHSTHIYKNLWKAPFLSMHMHQLAIDITINRGDIPEEGQTIAGFFEATFWGIFGVCLDAGYLGPLGYNIVAL